MTSFLEKKHKNQCVLCFLFIFCLSIEQLKAVSNSYYGKNEFTLAGSQLNKELNTNKHGIIVNVVRIAVQVIVNAFFTIAYT